MISEHPTFTPPQNLDIPIWRYMSLSNFIWMLQRSALYFSRSDLLGDPYEGHYPKKLLEIEDEIVRQLSQNDPDMKPEAFESARRAFGQLLNATKTFRQSYFVNCWHMNEHDFLAMGKIYAAHQESVCISSTYNILAEHLPAECHLGIVKYIDYDKDTFQFGNLFEFIVHKRIAFQHERELRSVIWSEDGSKGIDVKRFENVGGRGLVVPVDLYSLIQEIVVSPEASDMLLEVVQKLAQNYKVRAIARKSNVTAGPAY
jgi:hypothetical protein